MIANGAKLILVENSIPPRRGHHGDAGLDLALQEDVILRPGETKIMRAGVKLDLPQGYMAQVVTRSSTHLNFASVIPTVIDSNYKGEISTFVSNFNSFPITLKKGMYLAQVILTQCFVFENEDELIGRPQFERTCDEDKFGSTERKMGEANG
jgi:dUTP pyrophosphatase